MNWYQRNFVGLNTTQKIIKALWMLAIPYLMINFAYDLYVGNRNAAFVAVLCVICISIINALDKFSRKFE